MVHPPPAPGAPASNRLHTIAAVGLITIGLVLRLLAACGSPLWADEAESSLNALTILETGVPGSEYLGLPLYENTLTEPWPGHPEYEFRDSSYSDVGLAVYHGWLPLYAIAASQALCGIRPDSATGTAAPPHGGDAAFIRTLAPRIPSVLFSVLFLATVYGLVRSAGGPYAGLVTLTWLAVGFYGIKFGHQARYYSLTLLMSALCAAAAWRLHRRGRWIDYVLLGLAEGLLFHTHQLSALIFAITCLTLVPSILRHRHWFRKCLLAGGIAAVLTIPWAVIAGFFRTASAVPKAYRLFDSPADWASYFLDRPTAFLIACALLGLLFAARFLERRGVRAVRPQVSRHAPAYLFLIVWVAVAFLAFHLLVPAASFFFERLTLIVLTPFALFTGMVLSEFRPARAGPLALILLSCALPVGLLHIMKDLPKGTGGPTTIRLTVGTMTRFLEETAIRPPFRLYANPNQHLVWTYYTGLPVQSVAPVRPSFLARYSGTIVYIENAWISIYPDDEDLAVAMEAAGRTATPARIERLQHDLAHELLRRRLIKLGFDPARISHRDIPDVFRPFLARFMRNEARLAGEQLERSRSHTIFADVEASDIADLWLAFFYRFVDYPGRIGDNLNIGPVLRTARIHILPEARSVVYLRDALDRPTPEP